MYVSGSTETVFSPSQEKQSFLGKEDFFKLLTLQLQHQNFFNPQDNNEFMAQVMDMTIVEQLTNLNDRLSCFFEMEKQFQTITLLDQTVEVTKHDGTKAQGLAAALNIGRAGLDVVVACPSGVIGPYDYLGSEMGRLIRNLARPGCHLLVDGGFDFVDVRDVADGLIKVAEKGRRGEIYILGGTYVSLGRLHELVRAVAQTKSTRLVVPIGVALAIGTIMPYYYRLTRTIPQITTYSVRTVGEKCRFSHAKAARELDYKPRPLSETIADTLSWWEIHSRNN